MSPWILLAGASSPSPSASRTTPAAGCTCGFTPAPGYGGVKVVFADRAQNSGHSGFVPADPAHINLYNNGQLLHDDLMINQPLHQAVLTLRAGDEP